MVRKNASRKPASSVKSSRNADTNSNISRRQALRYLSVGIAGIGAAASLPLYLLWKNHGKQEQADSTEEVSAEKVSVEERIYGPKEYFEYGSKRYLDAIAEGVVQNSDNEADYLTTAERQKFENGLISKLKEDTSLSGRPIRIGQIQKAYEETLVRLEPDRRYADFLIQEARKSIEHMVGFLGTDYVKVPQIRFEAPSALEQISLGSVDGILVYLVAGYRIKRVADFNIEIEGSREIASIEYLEGGSSAGETQRGFTMESTGRGFKIKKRENMPIFYATSGDGLPVIIAETPAIEVLHWMLNRYTTANFEKEIENIGSYYDDLMERAEGGMGREEQVVHAISLIWFEKYNRERRLGFTQQELAQRANAYDRNEKYKGVNQLRQHIEKIGVKRTIELYATNPNALFKVIELK